MSNHAASSCNISFGEFFHLSAAMFLRNNAGLTNFNPVAIFVSPPDQRRNPIPEGDPRITEWWRNMRTKRLKNDLTLLINAAPDSDTSGLSFYILRNRISNFNSIDRLTPITAAAGLPASYNFLQTDAKFNTKFNYQLTTGLNIRTLQSEPGWKQGNATRAITSIYRGKTPATKTSYQTEAVTKWTGILTADEKTAIETYVSDKIFAGVTEENKDAVKRSGKFIIWSRVQTNDPYRNMNNTALSALIGLANNISLNPIIFGEVDGDLPATNRVTTYNFSQHYSDPIFNMGTHDNSYARQLYLLHHLYTDYNVIGIIGAKSGFIDGAALMGIPVISMEHHATRVKRMHQWARPVIPNYIIFPTSTFLQETGGPSSFTGGEIKVIFRLLKLCLNIKRKEPIDPEVLRIIRSYFAFMVRNTHGANSYSDLSSQFTV